jgi:hypothetical protein
MGGILSPHIGAIGSKTRFAVILCQFDDLPPLSISSAAFKNYIAGSGKGSLADYWRDISYGNIDLTASDVYGWYTMQYSYVRNGNLGRGAWIAEAKRLAAENGVDLSPYYGVIAVVNSNPDDSEAGRDFALGVKEWSQTNWWRCTKCQALSYQNVTDGSPPGPCPAGGVHDQSGTYDYHLPLNVPSIPGQKRWRRCIKCQGLVYGGNPSPGPCVTGGEHVYTDSDEYTVFWSSEAKFPGAEAKWQWCNKCQALTFAGGSVLGSCSGGGEHDHTGSSDYTLATPNYYWYYANHFSVSFGGHEMGHCFDLLHAHCADKDPSIVDYCDDWDVMGSGEVSAAYYDPTLTFAPVGPGLNAGNVSRLGWIPPDRIATLHATSGRRRNPFLDFLTKIVSLIFGRPPTVPTQTISLAALSQPEASGFLLARIITSNRIYTFEYRQRTLWDRGVKTDAVVAHELRSPYTLGENSWRWCSKCQGLAYAGLPVGPCPAGGAHDHSGSYDYSLVSGLPSFKGQNNWRWCRKCQGLAYAGKGPGLCAGGDPDSPYHDVSTPLDYTLIMGATTFVGQNNWKWCRKCQVLAFAGGDGGHCPAGGPHDFSASADYTLAHFVAAEPFLITSFQVGEQWDYFGAITMMVDKIDTTALTATITISGDISVDSIVSSGSEQATAASTFAAS